MAILIHSISTILVAPPSSIEKRRDIAALSVEAAASHRARGDGVKQKKRNQRKKFFFCGLCIALISVINHPLNAQCSLPAKVLRPAYCIYCQQLYPHLINFSQFAVVDDLTNAINSINCSFRPSNCIESHANQYDLVQRQLNCVTMMDRRTV